MNCRKNFFRNTLELREPVGGTYLSAPVLGTASGSVPLRAFASSASPAASSPKEELSLSTRELSERMPDRAIQRCSEAYARYVMPSGKGRVEGGRRRERGWEEG
jgi:hypothetical protein